MKIYTSCRLLLILLITLTMTASIALADGSAWMRKGYDLAQTRFYPYGSSHVVNFDDVQLLWSRPITSEIVLTGNVLDYNEGLELVSWDGQTLTVLANDGAVLCSTQVSGHTGYTKPILDDVTGDGVAEIICWSVGFIWVYDGDCNLIKSFTGFGTYTVGAYPICAQDFDQDGSIEILVRDGSDMVSIDYMTELEDWRTPSSTYGGRNTPVADINLDGTLEVVLDSRSGGSASTTVINTVNGDTLFDRNYGPAMTSHTIAEIGNPPIPTVICFLGRTSGSLAPLQMILYDYTGDSVHAWTGPIGMDVADWVVANLDEDPENELVVLTYNHGSTSHSQLFLIDDDMNTVIIQDDTLLNSANNNVSFCATDLTGDGQVEILITDLNAGLLRVLDNQLQQIWSYPCAGVKYASLSDLNGNGLPEIILAADSLIVLTLSNQAYAETVMSPDPLNTIWAYTIPPKNVSVFIGNFDNGYSAEIIDLRTAVLNDEIGAVGLAIHPSMEGFEGEVLELFFPAADFIQSYPTVLGTSIETYEVSGYFRDGQAFFATGEVTLIGKYAPIPMQPHLKVLPIAFALDQNVPNPFNPSTDISFSLPTTANVKLEVLNIMGQQVAVLVNEILPAGQHTVSWNGSVVSSGVYFYRITAGEFTKTRKMLLLK